MKKLDVCEIFYSLQGEGPFIGTPFVFLRLGGCVVPYCPFCDTKYAWNDFKSIELNNIFKKVISYGCKNILITGGEPFLHWERGLKNLVEMFDQNSFFIQYETSGKVDIPQDSKGIVVCSPKYLKNRWHFLENNLCKCDYFKFVASEDNLDVIKEFIFARNIERQRIYIMPLGVTREEQLKNMPLIFDFCKKYGFKMTPRLHILCHGQKQGI